MPSEEEKGGVASSGCPKGGVVIKVIKQYNLRYK
jgi:hypothetical protein